MAIHSMSVFRTQPPIPCPEIPLELRRRNVYFTETPAASSSSIEYRYYEAAFLSAVVSLTLGPDVLVRYEILYQTLSDALSCLDIGVPDRHGVIEEIMSFWATTTGGWVVPACVEVRVVCGELGAAGVEDEPLTMAEGAERMMRESAAEERRRRDRQRMVPASKAAIRALKRAVVKGGGMSCSVCLEELRVRSLATRMPCSHLFHRRCIARWLQSSHFCPVCRHEMPTA